MRVFRFEHEDGLGPFSTQHAPRAYAILGYVFTSTNPKMPIVRIPLEKQETHYVAVDSLKNLLHMFDEPICGADFECEDVEIYEEDVLTLLDNEGFVVAEYDAPEIECQYNQVLFHKALATRVSELTIPKAKKLAQYA